MKRIYHLVLLVSIAVLLPSFSVFAQVAEKAPLSDKGSLESQFREILDKSSNYQDMKVVKVNALNSFLSHVTDSLNKLKAKVSLAATQKAADQQAYESLKNQLSSANSELAKVSEAKDNIPFLFFEVNKAIYNKVVWSLVGVLALSLLVIFLVYKKTKGIINQTKADLEEKKNELDTFRKRALERESQISRNYLNELNKYRNGSALEFKN